MVKYSYDLVEKKIIETLEKIKAKLKIDADLDEESCPGDIGFRSQILLTAMVRMGQEMGVTIPHSCYIFHEKGTLRQLSIKEAAKKFIKEADYGK